MTPERLATILRLIAEAESQGEMAGLRYGWEESGEFKDKTVSAAFQSHALARGWWPVPTYGGPRK